MDRKPPASNAGVKGLGLRKQIFTSGVEHNSLAASNGDKSADEEIRNKLGRFSLVEVKALEDYSHVSNHRPNGILEFLSGDDIASPETKKFIANLQSKI